MVFQITLLSGAICHLAKLQSFISNGAKAEERKTPSTFCSRREECIFLLKRAHLLFPFAFDSESQSLRGTLEFRAAATEDG
jgi:hypothetical protein